MINNVIITGYYRGFKKNNLLLKVDGIGNKGFLNIIIDNNLKKELSKILKMNHIIGIKGNIKINDLNEIVIHAVKITVV